MGGSLGGTGGGDLTSLRRREDRSVRGRSGNGGGGVEGLNDELAVIEESAVNEELAVEELGDVGGGPS